MSVLDLAQHISKCYHNIEELPVAKTTLWREAVQDAEPDEVLPVREYTPVRVLFRDESELSLPTELP